MGDDLTFAQEFVDQTTNTLQDFFTTSARLDEAALTDAMTTIQSGAKKLHARGIYQSAQSVLRCLLATPSVPAQIDGRLLALNKLVCQYADGLAELSAPEADISAPVQEFKAEPIAANDDAAAFAQAKETLGQVLSFARPKEAEALTRLMTVRERSKPSEPAIALETVMRDIVQDALSIARICGKTISISYDVGESSLGQTALTNLQVRLGQSLRALILETLPADKVGHLDLGINGDELLIKAQGKAPQFIPKPSRMSAPDGDHIHLYLPLEAPEAFIETQESMAPRRMITDETESELRSQLSKLMEPSAPSNDDLAQGELAMADDTLAEVGT